MNWHKLYGKYKNKNTDRFSCHHSTQERVIERSECYIIATSDLLVGSIYQKYLNVRMIHVHV